MPTDLSVTRVPVLALVKANQTSRMTADRAGIVPFVGNLDINCRAQIHNWID